MERLCPDLKKRFPDGQAISIYFFLEGLGFRVKRLGFRVKRLGFRVKRLGFRV